MSKLLQSLTYPIFLSPMLGVVTPQMVAKVSNMGGLGGLPLGGQSAEKAHNLIRETKLMTDKIFAVNLFANSPVDLNENKDRIESMKNLISGIVREKGWAETYDFQYIFHPYQALIDVIIKENVRAVSFTFGILDEESIRRLKVHDIILIGTATCLEEAILLEKNGADIIVVQGIEAGGHRGSFMAGGLPMIKLAELISQIKSHVHLPIVAAGGIYNQETISEVMKLGAVGIQSGSIFIPAHESLATDFYRELLKQSKGHTILTKAYSGRWARGIKNEFMRLTEDMELPEYPIQNVLTKEMRRLAKAYNNSDFASYWAGENAYHAQKKSTQEIMSELISFYIQSQ